MLDIISQNPPDIQPTQYLLIFLELALLFMTLMITTRSSIASTIIWYRAQCLVLAFATALAAVLATGVPQEGTVWTAILSLLLFAMPLIRWAINRMPFSPGLSGNRPPSISSNVEEEAHRVARIAKHRAKRKVEIWLGFVVVIIALFIVVPGSGRLFNFIALLPLLLMLFIEDLLSRATLSAEPSDEQPHRSLSARERKILVQREWRQESLKKTINHRDKVAFMLLLGCAFLIAFLIVFPPQSQNAQQATKAIQQTEDAAQRAKQFIEAIGLAVSFCLHLVGLYNSSVAKGDMITQSIGLLVMDHGLYLAVVNIVAIPVPGTFFVVALYFYTFITALILLLMLPQVHGFTRTLNLDQIAKSSRLSEKEERRGDTSTISESQVAT